MQGGPKNLPKDHFCLLGLAFSFVVVALGAIFLVFFWSSLPPQIPLFYSRPWGEEQLAPRFQIIFLPSFAFLIFLFNIFASARLFSRELLLARILIGTGSVLIAVLILALFQIVNLAT